MKRWRTRGPAGHCLAAAALAVALIAGWTDQARAESRAPVVGTLSPEALKGLDDTIRNEIAAGKIPGGILLIKQHGKVVHFECFGVRDPDTGQPMTPDTIFQIYSMSKAVTSVAVMMLVDDGKLALDDSVPTGTYVDMCANLPVVDPQKIVVPTIVMRGEYDGIAGLDDLINFFKALPNPDKQFAVMPGIAHASFQQKNYMLVYHILFSFFSQPEPLYRG